MIFTEWGAYKVPRSVFKPAVSGQRGQDPYVGHYVEYPKKTDTLVITRTNKTGLYNLMGYGWLYLQCCR